MRNQTKDIILLCSIVLTFISVCHATTYEYDSLNRLIKAAVDDGTIIVYNYDVSGNRSQKIVSPLADIDIDGTVDFTDFAILAVNWWNTPGAPSADIAPWPEIDNIIDCYDLAKLAEQWLAGT